MGSFVIVTDVALAASTAIHADGDPVVLEGVAGS